MIYTPKRHSVYRSSYAKLHVSNIIVQIDIVWYIFETRLETKILASWTKSTLLRIYFRNFSVQRTFLQYKSQCLEKVNVKYVIKRLWHEIFHIVPGINPRPISALQLRCRVWYGSLRLIPGPTWKMSYNNLLIYIMHDLQIASQVDIFSILIQKEVHIYLFLPLP
jgi:hypothetical protein